MSNYTFDLAFSKPNLGDEITARKFCSQSGEVLSGICMEACRSRYGGLVSESHQRVLSTRSPASTWVFLPSPRRGEMWGVLQGVDGDAPLIPPP